MIGKVVYVDRLNGVERKNTSRQSGIYRHYGICIGEDCIAHFRHTGQEHMKDAKILKSTFKEFSLNKTIRICTMFDLYGTVASLATMNYRVNSVLGQNFGGYNLIYNNCEHFANWVATGQRVSRQVKNKDDFDLATKLGFDLGETVMLKLQNLDMRLEKFYEDADKIMGFGSEVKDLVCTTGQGVKEIGEVIHNGNKEVCEVLKEGVKEKFIEGIDEIKYKAADIKYFFERLFY